MKKIITILFFILLINIVSYAQCSNPDAGEDFSVCGNYATITVTNATTGYWSALRDGNPYPLTGLSDTTSTVFEFYFSDFSEPYVSFDFVWNDDSAPGCIAIVNVVFANPPIASVGPIEMAELCGNVTTLSADTTGDVYSQEMYWTAPGVLCSFDDETLPDANVEIDPVQFGDSAHFVAEFIWNVINYACHSTDTMYVTFYQRPDVYAGVDNAFCGYEGELGAILDLPETENYEQDCYWMVTSTPISGAAVDIFQANEDSTFVTVSHNGIYEFVIRENNSLLPMCYDRDSVQIDFVEIPVIYAGDDFNACGTCTNLNGITGGYSGFWACEGGTFDVITDSETEFCSTSYGEHELVWTETNQSTITSLICSSSDTVIVTLFANPTANIVSEPSDTFVCGLNTSILEADTPGSGINGYWYNQDPVVDYNDPFDLNPTVTVPNYGSYEFYWIEENGPALNPGFCNDTAGPFTIHFLEQIDVSVGADTEVYGYDYWLNGEIITEPDDEVSFSTNWYCVESTNITDPDSLITYVQVPAYGEYDFVLLANYENYSSCLDRDTLKVSFMDQSAITSNTIIVSPYLEDDLINLAGDNVMLSLYSEIEDNGEYILAELFQEQINGYSNQAVFTDLPDGVYYIQSQFVSPQDYYEFMPNLYFYESFDAVDASPIVMAGGSVSSINVEHKLNPVISGINAAYGQVGYETGKGIIGIENVVVVLYDEDNYELLDVCITNENGEYSFTDIRSNTNISMAVSSFIFPDRTDFEAETGEGIDYHIDFVVDGIEVWPVGHTGIDISPTVLEIEVYPNPASNYILINSDEDIKDISIYDINGRLVKECNIENNAVYVSDIESGIYLVELYFKDSIVIKKFVKQ